MIALLKRIDSWVPVPVQFAVRINFGNSVVDGAGWANWSQAPTARVKFSLVLSPGRPPRRVLPHFTDRLHDLWRGLFRYDRLYDSQEYQADKLVRVAIQRGVIKAFDAGGNDIKPSAE
jgi:hypothetical protein